MPSFCNAALALILACLAGSASARPTGAPVCPAGESAPGGDHLDFGPGSLSGRTGGGGSLSDGATVVTIGGITMEPNTTVSLPSGEDIVWQVQAFQVAYKGLLIRVSAEDDNTFTMTSDSADIVESEPCDLEAGNVIGFTHNSPVDKDIRTGILNFEGNGPVSIDISVVFVNSRVPPNDLSLFAYSGYSVTIGDAAPVDGPTASPTVGNVTELDEESVALPGIYYIAYVAPDATREPTEDEYAQALLLINDFYADYFTTFYNGTDITFVRAEFVLDQTLFNAGIPEERFNIYMQFASITLVFASSGSVLPTPDEAFALVRDGVNEVFILDYIRTLTDSPFETTNEVIFREVNGTLPPETEAPVAAPTEAPDETTNAPTVTPETTDPPSATPGETEPPTAEPVVTEPPTEEPEETEPPTQEPEETEPPTEEPEETEAPGTDEPETEPPTEEPEETEPPVHQPDEGKGKGKDKEPKGDGKGDGKGGKGDKEPKGSGKGSTGKGDDGKGGKKQKEGKGGDDDSGKGKKGDGKGGKGPKGDGSGKGKKGDSEGKGGKGKGKGDDESGKGKKGDDEGKGGKGKGGKGEDGGKGGKGDEGGKGKGGEGKGKGETRRNLLRSN